MSDLITNICLFGDSLEMLKTLPDEIIQTCVTSPPYWGLRDYGVDGQLGLEKTPEEYVNRLATIFDEVKRVLKEDGTLWLNLGDSYATSKACNTNGTGNGTVRQKANVNTNSFKKICPPNLKPKDLVGIPWMVAFELRRRGWYLRQDIIWHKPNPMPESVKDRCTKSHEYIFLLSKSQKYYFNNEAIQESFSESTINDSGFHKNGYSTDRPERYYPGSNSHGSGLLNAHGEKRNKRSVWTVATKPYRGSHFAVFPDELIKPCILAGSKPGDIVLDTFFGSGTTGEVCLRSGRKYLGIDLNEKYKPLQDERLAPFLKQNELFKAVENQ